MFDALYQQIREKFYSKCDAFIVKAYKEEYLKKKHTITYEFVTTYVEKFGANSYTRHLLYLMLDDAGKIEYIKSSLKNGLLDRKADFIIHSTYNDFICHRAVYDLLDILEKKGSNG